MKDTIILVVDHHLDKYYIEGANKIKLQSEKRYFKILTALALSQ